jgi:hypothetical protein
MELVFVSFLETFFMKFSSRLDISYHRPPHPSKDGGVVANGLTNAHSVIVKRLIVINRRCINKGLYISAQVKPHETEIRGTSRP